MIYITYLRIYINIDIYLPNILYIPTQFYNIVIFAFNMWNTSYNECMQLFTMIEVKTALI